MFKHDKTYAEQKETAKDKARLSRDKAIQQCLRGMFLTEDERSERLDLIFEALRDAESVGELKPNWFVRMKVEEAIRAIGSGYLLWAVEALLEIQRAGYDVTVDDSTIMADAKERFKNSEQWRAEHRASNNV